MAGIIPSMTPYKNINKIKYLLISIGFLPNTPGTPMFEQAFKNIDDILWKEDGCTTELDYTEQTSWLPDRTYRGEGGPCGWKGGP